MYENTEFDPAALPESASTITLEDELLLERLVDDELDEDERDFILARLDEIPEGWRMCALAFLEDQAFRSSFRQKDSSDVDVSFQDSPGESVPIAVRSQKKIGDRKSVGFGYAVTAVALLVCAVGIFRNGSTPPLDAPTSFETAGPKFAAASNDVALLKQIREESSADSYAEPDDFLEDEIDSVGMIAATSPLGQDFSGEQSPIRAKASFARGNVEESDILALPKQEDLLATNDGVGSEGNAKTFMLTPLPSPSPDTSARPEIRTVTLNCPQHGLNNVSASCVEGERYDPDFFRQTSSELPDELVGALNQEGARIERRRDEFRFSLGDGRVLILPIDAYDVIYDNQQIW